MRDARAEKRDDGPVALLAIVLVVMIVVWIARWDLRAPGAADLRARNPFARPRPEGRRLAGMIAAAIAICLLALAVLPHLDRFRFP